jgi:hypothetical protein
MNTPSTRSVPDVTLRNPGDLIAAVPALLGFHPRDSVVVVGFADEGLGPLVQLCLRIDLPEPRLSRRKLTGLAEHLVRHATRRSCGDIMVVVIGGGPAASPPPGRDLVAALRRATGRAGVELRDAVWTAQVARGERWRCYESCACSGSVPDPKETTAAAVSVAAGHVIRGERGEVEQLVAGRDPAVLRRRSALVDQRIDEHTEGGRGVPSPRASFDLVLRWLERAARELLEFSDADIVELSLALADPVVRDACLGFATDGHLDGAERLWAVLVREMPDPEAAEPATLLASCAFARRDGILAGVALQRAQEAWPGHALSEMLDAAMLSGQDPEQLLALIEEGADSARVMIE